MVREAFEPERVLEDTGLGVRPVEDGDLVEPDPVGPEVGHHPRHPLGLLRLVAGLEEPGRLAGLVLRPEGLPLALLVVGDDRRRDLEDPPRRAVVLLEPDDVGARVVALEVEDVPQVRPAEAIDRLVGIADDAEVVVGVGEEPEEAVLGGVRVLVLVDQDVAPEPSVVGEDLRVLGPEADGQGEEVVEVERPRPLEPRLVALVDARHLELARASGGGPDVVGALEPVLGATHPVDDGGGGRDPLVEGELAAELPHQGEPVGLVVDDEVPRVAQVVDVRAQDARAGGVERGDEGKAARRPPGPLREEARHALRHLARRLVREGDGEDVPGIDPLSHQVGDPVGDDPGLPAARPREDEERALGAGNRLALGGIEPGQERVRHGRARAAGRLHGLSTG